MKTTLSPTQNAVVVTSAQVLPFDVNTLLTGQLTRSSIAMYRRDIAAYNNYTQEHGLDALNVQSLMAWRDDLALRSTMSPNTINRMVSAVKRIIKQAAQKELIDENTALRFKNMPGVKVNALKERLKHNARTRIEPDAMRAICEAPDTSTLVGKRDKALLLTLATSGLRASELASLTIGQIRKSKRSYIISVIGKKDIDPRDAHLSPEAYTAIMDWIAARPVISDAIFTSFKGRGQRCSIKAMSETAVWLIVTHYAERVGLGHVKPHDFRRFVGTQLAMQDIRKAQKALGHKSIEITARHYVLDSLDPGATDHLF